MSTGYVNREQALNLFDHAAEGQSRASRPRSKQAPSWYVGLVCSKCGEKVKAAQDAGGYFRVTVLPNGQLGERRAEHGACRSLGHVCVGQGGEHS